MTKDARASILVVDDAEEIRSIVRLLLEDAGHKVREAPDGVEALNSVEARPPDLILLDIDMPRMNGLEACRQLKAAEKTRDIPIIFLTSLSSPADIARAFEVGGVDYVIKPVTGSELLARIRTHVDLRRATQRLNQLADDLSKYLSPQVYSSIFKGETGVRIESSLKPVTICFADIVEFTRQVEAGNPQELTQWLNNYFNEMARIVTRHGGTLDKYIGDAMLVIYGAPSSQGEEQDATACVLMARDMLAKASELGIGLRIGISSGQCTVGNFGSELQMNYTIMGKEANVAARLQTECAPGRILISDSTYQQVKENIECVANAEIQVKGLDRSVMTYWADA